MLKQTSLFVAAALFSLTAQAAPDVGDPAPDFTLPGTDGMEYTLSDLRGRYLVIAFFPKAYTTG
ncbi:MAG: redoxin domain-containing protein [Gammaproteobacteria bacterium]